MKKFQFLKRLQFCVTLFVLFCVAQQPLFAQEVEPEPGIGLVLLDQLQLWLTSLLGTALLTFGGFVAIMISLTAWVNKNLSLEDSGGRQWVSWIVGLILGALGYWLDLGIYEGVTIPVGVVITAAAILAANRFYSTEAMYNVLIWLGMLKPKKT